MNHFNVFEEFQCCLSLPFLLGSTQISFFPLNALGIISFYLLPCEQTDRGGPSPFRQEAAIGSDPPVSTDGPPRSAAFNEPLKSTAATATQSSQITHTRFRL